jgi:hypothetical protein
LADTIKIDFSGFNEVATSFEQMRKRSVRANRAGLHAGALAIMAISVRLVPVDFNFLRGSAFVEKPRQVGKEARVRVGYGTKYAAAVHERTEVNHTVGQAKYLTDAIDNNNAVFLRVFSMVARRVLFQGKRHGFGTSFNEEPNEPSESEIKQARKGRGKRK